MVIGGIDVGTTGCKLTVYNEDGQFLSQEYVEYEVSRSVGEHEINANVIFDGVLSVIAEVAKKVGNIDAIGITTFGETFVMLDKDDKVLFNSMLYTDIRGNDEAKLFDQKLVCDIAGVKPHAMYSLPKIMWIKNHRREIYENAKRILLFEDFIVYMLTGIAQIDYSLAARTMGLDIRNKCWSKQIFSDAEVDICKMSQPVKSGTVAGKIKKELADKLNLKNTVIVNGCHDQVAAAVGSGVVKPGFATDGTGTVECVTPVFEGVPENASIYEGNYSVVPFIKDGTYVCYALSYTGGAAIKWYKNTFAPNSSYNELSKGVTREPTGILVLPHFAGAANPFMDSYSKAAFIGITLETTGQQLYQAVMEGVTYEMLYNLKYLEKSGISPKRLYATGGGAKSKEWLQMKADILGREIVQLDADEAGTSGTVMLTGIAVGAFADMEDALSKMVKEKAIYCPNEQIHKRYMQYFEKYKNLYKAVRPLV